MPISLSRAQVDIALPKVQEGLEKYLWLQTQIANRLGAWDDMTFRSKFKNFYGTRFNTEDWHNAFFGLMGRASTEQLEFHEVLDLLLEATGRYEASFASKLMATLNPSLPVIDRFILSNLGLRLPHFGAANRVSRIVKIYKTLGACFDAFLATEDGRYLVDKFRSMYPTAAITEVKMVDLVLWQTRA